MRPVLNLDKASILFQRWSMILAYKASLKQC